MVVTGTPRPRLTPARRKRALGYSSQEVRRHSHPPGPPKGVPRKDLPRTVYGPEETRVHEEAVEQLMLSFASFAQTLKTMGEQFSISRARTRKLMDRIRARWAASELSEKPTNRAKQIAVAEKVLLQIDQLFEEAAGKNAMHAKTNLLRTKLSWAQHLADLTGSRAPIKIEETHHHIGEVTHNVIIALTTDEATEMLQASRERARLAKAYIDMVPALPAGNAE